MNKTYNINLGGVPFQIDDVAFEKLNAYLQAVKRKFSSVEGKNEIVEDIEARIAEMFQENLKNSGRSIVSVKDVDGAISTMGKPEEFDQGYTDESAGPTSSSYRVGRKLYRDPDDKVLGGVVSGVTKYFGFGDPTWFRVALFLLPFIDWLGLYISTGLVILTYIVLWIVVPKAITSTQKMQMRGEPVNLDNIERSFNDEFENVKKNLNHNTSGGSALSKIGHVFGVILRGFAKLLLALGLLFLACIIIGLIIAFLGGAFGIGAAAPFISGHIFGNGWMSWAVIIGLLLIFLAPTVFLITLFIKLLFKTNTKMPAIALGTFGAFIIGCLLSGISLGSVIQDFSTDLESTEKEEILLTGNEFTVQGSNTPTNQKSFRLFFGDEDKEISIEEDVDLKILSTRDSTGMISIVKRVKGRNEEVAKKRLNNIQYTYRLDSNEITLDNNLQIGGDGLWRDQQVDVLLHIPENTILNFHSSSEEIIEDGLRVNNHWYSDDEIMNQRRWKLTNDQLIKVDAEGNEIEEVEPTEWDTEDSTIIKRNNERIDVNLFGEKFLSIDVDERAENGDAERVVIRLGDDKIVDINVNEEGERIRIDTDNE